MPREAIAIGGMSCVNSAGETTNWFEQGSVNR
jgi:hypothetical protein